MQQQLIFNYYTAISQTTRTVQSAFITAFDRRSNRMYRINTSLLFSKSLVKHSASHLYQKFQYLMVLPPHPACLESVVPSNQSDLSQHPYLPLVSDLHFLAVLFNHTVTRPISHSKLFLHLTTHMNYSQTNQVSPTTSSHTTHQTTTRNHLCKQASAHVDSTSASSVTGRLSPLDWRSTPASVGCR